MREYVQKIRVAIAASQQPDAASVGNNIYTFAASYDDLRPASMSLSATSGGTMLYATARTYDAVGNVASVSTTLAAGTPTCGRSLAPGSLSAAAYTATYAYDALNRLSSATGSGAQGSYTYGDSAHLHAATATSSGGYSATYDVAGDLICRAPNSAVTCAGGSPTGAVMTYDNERRLTSWQSAPSNPGATASYAYDGEGHRVAQQVTAGGTTTTTYYVAGLEEQANVSGGSSTLTKYYSVPGVISAVNVGGTLSFLASDGLGSVSEALSSTSAAATSQQLYGPYGGLRYATGNMPTAKGYTGQYADVASSGLDYYGARYYDPLVGQFASADSTADGLNRYGYVAGNPETATDPSGHRVCESSDCAGNDAHETYRDCSAGKCKPKESCDAKCRRDKWRDSTKTKIKRAVQRHEWAEDAKKAVADMAWDLGFAAGDLLLAISGDASAIVALAGDITTALADYADFRKDIDLLLGDTAAAAADATFAQIAHVASVIINAVALVATLGFSAGKLLGGISRSIREKSAILGQALLSVTGDLKEATSSFQDLSDDQAVAQLGSMDNMSDQQLQTYCEQVRCDAGD